MAIYRYDRDQRKQRKLTAQEVKRITMRSMGLDPQNADDNKIYRRRYDTLRKKVVNYNILSGESQKKVSISELMYSIEQRKLYGQELTQEQKNISTTISINSKAFKKRLENYDVRIIAPAIEGIEKIYDRFINNSKEGAEYKEWLNEVIKTQYINTQTGELITKEDAATLSPSEYTTQELTRREVITPEEVNIKLRTLTKTLHARQKAIYNASKSMYSSARDVGSW